MTSKTSANARSPDAVNTGPLGERADYIDTYTPSLLHSLSRSTTRRELGTVALRGEDVWSGYDFTWLNGRGMPQVAALRVRVTCASPSIVESKSMKLYLGSFAQTKFDTRAELINTLDQDLSLAFQAPVMVELIDLEQLAQVPHLPGRCLDRLDVHMTRYTRDPELLEFDPDAPEDKVVNETIYTDLFRSLCPVTGQPDLASVSIAYTGRPLDHAALLKYLVSYRSHSAFHEATVEQIFADLYYYGETQQLSVYGRFQRRGGIDINPFRATDEDTAPLFRLTRQ